MRDARQAPDALALAHVQRFYDALVALNEALYRPENLLEFQLSSGSDSCSGPGNQSNQPLPNAFSALEINDLPY